MTKKYPIKLNENVYVIDGFDLGVSERTGIYVLDEEHLTIVETGASPSVKHVKEGLATLGFSLEQVKYIIVTHIHLDHSGGAGLLLEECPNATVVVHKRGARHLVEPERLIAGAKAVYGDKFAVLFDPILPIPEERILIKEEGETLKISETCTLTFLDTPGHSRHHFSIYHPVSNGVFTGDTVGIRYEQLIPDGIDFYLPSTSPNQFDPAAMQHAIDRMLGMDLAFIYYGHFGMTDKPDEALQKVSVWLDVFMELAETVAAEQQDYKELAQRLSARVRESLKELGVHEDHEVYRLIDLDLEVSAMGIMDYLSK